MVRIAERQVGEAYGEQTELRTRHRRGRYQWRRAQRHPHAERVAGSAGRCARGGRVEVSRHRLGAAPDRARRAPRRPREAASNSVSCTSLDINQDGRMDILTTSAHDYGLMWFEQTADGRWLPHVIDSTWSQAHASAAGRSQRRRTFGPGDRQALHGAQRQRSRRTRTARRSIGTSTARTRRARSNGSATWWITAGGWAAACRSRCRIWMAMGTWIS